MSMRHGDTTTRRHGETTFRRGLAASPRLRVAASFAALLLLAAPAAHACAVCFGNSDSPMAKGTNNAVWVMLGIVGFVQIGFVALFISFWRRAREIRKRRERFRLIDGFVR